MIFHKILRIALINRLIRRIERINSELQEAWMPVTKILLRYELSVTHQTMASLFTKAEIRTILRQREDVKNSYDLYIGHFWLKLKIYEVYSDESEAFRGEIERRFQLIRFSIHQEKYDI